MIKHIGLLKLGACSQEQLLSVYPYSPDPQQEQRWDMLLEGEQEEAAAARVVEGVKDDQIEMEEVLVLQHQHQHQVPLSFLTDQTL